MKHKSILRMLTACVLSWTLCCSGMTVPAFSADDAEELPECFDWREEVPEILTPVKKQVGGTCWAHATIGCIESNLIRKGMADNSIDLSEAHLIWFTEGQGAPTDSDDLHPQNDITVISGFQYYFWIYYQDYLLDPAHYEMHIRNYLDGTFETDADFLTADMQEKLAKAIAVPRIAEADAVRAAQAYAAALPLPDLPDVLYQPSERFGEKPQLLVYSLEEERLAYLIPDPQINRYELGTGMSAILCEVAAKVYVDAVTGEALENRFMITKSVS